MSDRQPTDRSDGLRLPPMTRGTQIFSMVMFFVLGAGVTAFVVGNPFGLSFLPSRGPAGPPATEHVHEESATQLYQCPMHPEVIESEPGECPICRMDLVPMKPSRTGDPAEVPSTSGEEPEIDDSGTVSIDPVQVQNIGVVSVPARLEDISRSSRTIGILDFNAERITWINTKFEGWIEKVHVNYVGQQVEKGQPLFEIYSPELVTTQEEYLRALEYQASLENSERVETRRQADSLLRSTRDRLTYWDISEEQIRALEASRQVQRRLTVLSPADGVVAEIMDEALEGMYVRPGMDLYKIADLSTVWVHADVYESELPWIRDGLPAVVTFRHDPQRTYRGNVLFLYPEVSPETRTLKICVEVPNGDRKLRPGMYADVVIQGPPVHDAVVIPLSAVIRSGARDIVFVDRGEGRFQPREVKLGVKGNGDRIQVIEGVRSGDAVVTQAQFMLDSESRIQEAIAAFRERGSAGNTAAPADDSAAHDRH